MLNLKENGYFNSLNKMIQESIMQSGKDFESEGELVLFVSNLDGGVTAHAQQENPQ